MEGLRASHGHDDVALFKSPSQLVGKVRCARAIALRPLLHRFRHPFLDFHHPCFMLNKAPEKVSHSLRA